MNVIGAEIHNNAPGCNNDEEVIAACIEGVSNISNSSEFHLYPNPSDKEFIIESSHGRIIDELNIYNLTGQKVVVETAPSQGVQISGLEQGVYIVEIISDGLSFREKLIIR